MSRGASEILARIFEPRPERRITINQLRAAIRALDTFFPAPVPRTPRGMSREFWDADTLTAEASTFVNAAPDTRADADEWAAASMPPISDSASSSDAESAGPVTPTTIAHDPATLVPDEFALEEECDITSAQPPARLSVSLQGKKLPKTVQRLVSAVQRIKIRA
ncbi:hypothetical protein A0H81_09567 [Grifola frondosa]|uniref:Uncharacterized protein n=1 Tax=Grifola frondosa TaxID=5627 RepID=A0A1C7M0M0_GRIFR|nr:hypothetical protein A0H81_09567 [Grifola frondosa]